MIIMNKQERMDKSIWETYRSIGDVLVEAGLMGSEESKDKNTLRGVKAKLGRGLGPKGRKNVKAVKKGANEIAKDVIAGQDAARNMGADEA